MVNVLNCKHGLSSSGASDVESKLHRNTLHNIINFFRHLCLSKPNIFIVCTETVDFFSNQDKNFKNCVMTTDW